jgi:3',5'-cyclic AMP phosphodiesterase CpdA
MIIRKLCFWLIAVSLLAACSDKKQPTKTDDSFSFVFMTDIHLKPEMNAPKGFQMAIDKTNELNPDFVITGGDLVYDAMRGGQARCDSLFSLYKEMSKGLRMPVYNTLGNHDLFAIYPESPEPETNPDYKYGMFERYFGKTYYSFNHKGWHFIVLNSLDVTEDKKYRGHFHDEQLEWLKSDLEKTDTLTPVVVVSHIPMLSVRGQLTGAGPMIDNVAEVFNMLENHKLKLILQGHIHWKESGQVNDRFEFITGGSIAGNGWKGRRHNTKEGFVLVKVQGEALSWEYIDHGWENERLKLTYEKNEN